MNNSIEGIEEKFKKGDLDKNGKGHTIIEGCNSSVIISAPHSVPQNREGMHKIGEFRSGVLAIILNKVAECHIIYKTKNNQDDANYDEVSEYKKDLIDYIRKNDIKVLIDLHLSLPTRPFDFDIGTNYKKNILGREDILKIIVDSLSFNNNNVAVDKVFTSEYKHTVSSTISRELKIPCFQIEINWQQVDNEIKFNNIINTFKEIIKEIDLIINAKG